MKKFIVFLIVTLVASTFVATALRLQKDREELYIKPSNAYYNVTETVVFGYTTKNMSKKVKANITVESSNKNVIEKREDGTFAAVGGGDASIIVTMVNASGKKFTFEKSVSVGDGTFANPYFVRSEKELVAIGEGTPEERELKLKQHYRQPHNITLTKPFETIKGVFEGSYRGLATNDNAGSAGKNYAKIIGFTPAMKESGTNDCSAMFETIGENAMVGYLTFENVAINGEFTTASVVAMVNNGKIDYITIESGSITNTFAGGTVSAIAGSNLSLSDDKTKTASISRCLNYATIETKGTKAAGIVFENNGTVGYCGSFGDVVFDVSSAGSLTFGGIVGINKWNELFYESSKTFIDEANFRLKPENYVNEETEQENLEYLDYALELRPIVKDCYFTGSLSLKAGGNAPLNSMFGGIVGVENHGYTKADVNVSDLKFDNLTIGNYYLAGDYSDNFRLIKRGIGNFSYTTEQEIKEFDSSLTSFVAIGLNEEDFQNGIMLDVLGNLQRRDFVSYVQDGVVVYWTDSEMYFSFAITDKPTLITPVNNFEKLSYSAPNFYLSSIKIDSVDRFLAINFTQLTTEGLAQKFVLENDLDFTGVDISKFANYYDLKGKKGTPAYFEISSTPIPNLSGIGHQTDEFGNVKYYGFKNLTMPITGEFTGLFGFAKNSKMDNVRFENCSFTAAANTTDIGIVYGVGDGVELNGVVAVNSVVAGAAAVKNIGGLAGSLTGAESSFKNCFTQIVLTGETTSGAFAGTVVGRADANLNITACKAVSDIQLLNAYAGGIIGFAGSGVSISQSLATGKISAAKAGGIANTLYGGISLSKTNLELLATSENAGIAVDIYGGANVANCDINTKFSGSTSASRAGLAITLRLNALISNVIFENNFIGGSSTVNYAKTKNLAKVTHYDDQIIESGYLIESGVTYNADSSAGEVKNCLMINRYNGSYSEGLDSSKTTFYRNRKEVRTSNDYRSFEPTTIYQQTGTVLGIGLIPKREDVYGTWAGCALTENGTSLNIKTYNSTNTFTFSKAGFVSVWVFTDDEGRNIKPKLYLF